MVDLSIVMWLFTRYPLKQHMRFHPLEIHGTKKCSITVEPSGGRTVFRNGGLNGWTFQRSENQREPYGTPEKSHGLSSFAPLEIPF